MIPIFNFDTIRSFQDYGDSNHFDVILSLEFLISLVKKKNKYTLIINLFFSFAIFIYIEFDFNVREILSLKFSILSSK